MSKTTLSPTSNPAPTSEAKPISNQGDVSGPSTTAAPQATDMHAGKGGLYQMVDGVRTLVERTDHVGDTPAL